MVRILLTVVTLLLTPVIGSAQAPKERKNIDKMTPQELAVYKHAITVLKKSTDPTNNYVYHANLHNLFLSSPPHGCEHGNDLFFPWHRWHLSNFEKALQASDPDHPTLSTKNVTIPYWNWTQAPSGKRFPKDFENELDGTAANPLYDDLRETTPSGPIYSEAYMTGIVRDADWNRFAGGPKATNPYYGTLESDSHNTMHPWIGINMGHPTTAAMDPIYWSFHGFIDMQWDRWQKIYNKPPTSLTSVLQGFSGSPTVSQTVKVTDLGYSYTHTPESIAAPAAPPAIALVPRAQRLSTSIVGAENMVAAWGGEGPFPFKGVKPAAFQRADLWFDGVRIPETLSYRVEVFLHPAGQKPEKADSAGSFTVWIGHKTLNGKSHHSTANFFLPVTDKLKKVLTANADKELTTTVVTTPIIPRTRPRAPKPVVLPVEDEVQFRGVRLVLDGGGPFQAPKQGGTHGH